MHPTTKLTQMQSSGTKRPTQATAMPLPATSDDSRRSSTRPLRVALLISELEVGGAEKNLVRLAIGLQQRGHWVTVYSLDPAPPPPQDALVQQLQSALIPLRFLSQTPNRIANRQTHAALRQAQADDQVDLVYSFLFRANLANVRANRGVALDHPLQATTRWLRRVWHRLRTSTAPPSAADPANATRVPIFDPNRPRHSTALPIVVGLRQADPRPIVRRLEAILLRQAQAAVCVSQHVAQHYAPNRPVLAPNQLSPQLTGQLLVIPNGISLPLVSLRSADPGCSGSPGPLGSPLGPVAPPADLLQCLATTPAPLPHDSIHPPLTPQSPTTPSPTTATPTTASAKSNGLPHLQPPLSSPAGLDPLPVLLYVGRLTHQKGLDELLAVSPRLLAELPQHHLVLVGQGDQREALERQAQALDCRHRIHFLGWRPNPLDYLAAAQIVLLNSRWEGQPNVILEAMSLGKPVVTTHTAGIDEIFHDPIIATPPGTPSPASLATRPSTPTTIPITAPSNAQTELSIDQARAAQVIPIGSPEALVAAVLHLVQNPATAEKIGLWNRARVQEHFSLTRFLDSHEQVFRQLAPE
jgi:glycosyltransferase involved in cell wall biosynthesis